MNYKTHLFFLSLIMIVVIGLIVFCWVLLFLSDIHLGILGVLIAVIPFGYMYFGSKFKVVRREK